MKNILIITGVVGGIFLYLYFREVEKKIENDIEIIYQEDIEEERKRMKENAKKTQEELKWVRQKLEEQEKEIMNLETKK